MGTIRQRAGVVLLTGMTLIKSHMEDEHTEISCLTSGDLLTLPGEGPGVNGVHTPHCFSKSFQGFVQPLQRMMEGSDGSTITEQRQVGG